MRKCQQRQILELLKTISHAQSKKLFADCQDGALAIADFIESIEGDGGVKTIALLEEYCELLFKAYNGEFGEKALGKHLIKIENSIRNELKPNKIEVVFFPYQLSMFDSLESVYLAAKADPNCDAYIVPIPYYELDSDGTLGKMHYDGDKYPPHIQVTDWREYDVEVRCPDVIFTHYAYDDSASNASIHPNYYSKRLRELCETLIYIPYFVSINGSVDDYCVYLPGVLHAHHIIVESEAVRQSYIDYYEKFDKKFGWNGRFGKAREKFIVLGSPKYDKVVNTKCEDCELPDDWRELIFREDGTRKKVVLYNTHMFGWIKGGKQYFKKIQQVFDTFRNRDDVVLWWRPHPNTELNFRTKRPHLLGEYKRVVADYKRGGWGIYDDSADLHRAISISDAMYGDFSSVGALFAVTGKPVLMSNCEMDYSIDEAAKYEYLHSDIINFGQQLLTVDEFAEQYPDYSEYCVPYKNAGQNQFVIIPDYGYGTSNFLNAIYKVEETEGKAEFFTSFPEEKNLPCRYHAPIRIGHRLLFIPNSARKWAFYDLTTDVWTYESVSKEFYPSNEWRPMFGGGLIYGDDIIILPGESGALAKYNIGTGKITYYRDWFSSLRGSVVNVDWGSTSSALYYKDLLLLLSPQTNMIIAINPRTMSVERTYKVGSDGCGFRTACIIPNTDTVYLIRFRELGKEPWTETIVKWNIKSGDIKQYTDFPINFIKGHTLNALGSFVFWRNELFITPLQGDSVLKIDLETDEITRLPLTPEFDFFARKSKYYENWAKDQALSNIIFNCKRMKFMVQLPFDYSLADVNFVSGEISNRRKWFVEGVEALYRTKDRKPNSPLAENPFLTLDSFLDELGTEELKLASKEQLLFCCDALANADGTAGQAIYGYIKNLARI